MRFLLLLAALSSSIAIAEKGFLAEALLARVGREAVTLSDVVRFQDVESVMRCAGLRQKEGSQEAFGALLGRYLEEELIFSEANTKKITNQRMIGDAVNKIHQDKKCQSEWQAAGKRYGKIWSTKARPLEGEGMLVRELEKRLQIDNYTKTQIQGDKGIWLREAKVKIPVKLYLE